jgi:hypothetical protein
VVRFAAPRAAEDFGRAADRAGLLDVFADLEGAGLGADGFAAG